MTLESNYDVVPESETTERKEYEKQIITEFSTLLNIENNRFEIRSIKAGSVIINFSILPSGKDSAISAEEAVDLLAKHIGNPQSDLFSSSSFPILKAVNVAKSLSGGKLSTTLVSIATGAATTASAVINAAQSAIDNTTMSSTDNEKIFSVENMDYAVKQNIIPEEKMARSDEDNITQGITKENSSNDADKNEDKCLFDVILMQAYINILWTKYGIQSKLNITVEEFHHWVQDITGHDTATKEDSVKILEKIHEKDQFSRESTDSIDTSQIIVFLSKFVEMNDGDKANFTCDDTLPSIFIDFMSKLDVSYNDHVKEQMKSYEPFVAHLWDEFANNNITTMAEKEIIIFLQDITGKESLASDIIRSFIARVQNCDPTNQDPTGEYEISKDQLSVFVLKTIYMSTLKESFENEEKPLGGIMSDFSVGLASEIERFKHIEEAKNADPYKESEVVAFVDSIWHKYDSDSSGSIDAEETKKMIEDVTRSENALSIELCQKFLKSVTQNSHQNDKSDTKIMKDNLLDLVHDGIAMTSQEREEYASRGILQKTMVDFFIGVDEARVEFRNAQIENIKQFFVHIWGIYDSDHSGFIEADETKFMLEDLTGLKNVSDEDAKKFLASIDTDETGKIDKDELTEYIFHGILMSEEQRLQYSKRHKLDDMILQFFAGVDKARQIFNQHGGNALQEHMQDIAEPDIKIKEIVSYAEKCLWVQYIEAGSDTMDTHAIKKMIEDVTKRDDIGIHDVEVFLKGIGNEEKEMTKETLITFLGDHLCHHMTIQEREAYGKENKAQQLEINFISGVNRNSKVFLKQEAKDIELLITEVWSMYDQKDLGCLGPAEVKLMLEDLSGLNNVSEMQVKQFLLSIDEDKTGTIDRGELSNFIHEGLCMSTTDRIEYSKRGELHNIMVQFFDGVDIAKNIFIEKGRDDLDTYLLSKKMKGGRIDDDINHDVENVTLKVASDNDKDKPEENALNENTIASSNLPLEENETCWVENSTDRWHGDYVGCIFQGVYLGQMEDTSLHCIELLEDGEILEDVTNDELYPFSDVDAQVGDILFCRNGEREGWEEDGLYRGVLVEFSSAEDGLMVVDFGDEVCHDILMEEVLHLSRQQG